MKVGLHDVGFAAFRKAQVEINFSRNAASVVRSGQPYRKSNHRYSSRQTVHLVVSGSVDIVVNTNDNCARAASPW